jgi:hypothetical protein
MHSKAERAQRLRLEWEQLLQYQAELSDAYIRAVAAGDPSRQQLEDLNVLLLFLSEELQHLRRQIAVLVARPDSDDRC